MAKTTGTGYTNLQQYLSANQNNKLGSTLSGGIQSSVDAANQNLNQQNNTFNSELDKSNQVLNAGVNNANTIANNLSANPTAINDQNINDYNAFKTSTYGGPKGLADNSTLQANVDNLGNVSSLAHSGTGRGELLKSYLGAPKYTQSQQNLDSILMGPTADQSLHTSVRNAEQFTNDVNGAKQNASFRSQVAQSGLPAAQNAAADKFNTFGNNLQKTLDNRVQNTQAQNDRFSNDISKRDLYDLNDLGYGTDSLYNNYTTAKTYGDGDKYFNAAVTPNYGQNISPSGLANENDRAAATALSKLTGNNLYDSFATGPAYVAPTLGIDMGKGSGVIQDEYNRLMNTSLNAFAKDYGAVPATNLQSELNYLGSGNFSNNPYTGASDQSLKDVLNKTYGAGDISAQGVNTNTQALKDYLAKQFSDINQVGTRNTTATPTETFSATPSGTPTAPPQNPTQNSIVQQPDGSRWSWNPTTQSWGKLG